MVQVGDLLWIVKCMMRTRKSRRVNKIIEGREREGAVLCVYVDEGGYGDGKGGNMSE